jgi:protein-L-isoaspartate(D-aspartate) O-methyltransferase
MDYDAARACMVAGQIKPQGVRDPRILAAFGAVPREAFAPEGAHALAYADAPVDMGGGRALPAPAVHARLLALAEPQPTDVALEIGAGAGYGAAILDRLVGTVVALEGDAALLAAAQARWDALEATAIVALEGDPAAGDAAHAPFDLIVVNGAVAAVPDALVAQLAPGTGRLVTVLRPPGAPIGRGVLVRPLESGGFSAYPAFDAACPYHPAFAPGPRASVQ